MITLLVILAVLAVIALAVSPRFNPTLYRWRLFSPEPYSEAEYAKKVVAEVEPVDVYIKTKSGATIHGWYYGLDDAKQAVLISHGNAGNITSWKDMAGFALRNGMAAFVYDYRGYGLSDSVPTLWGICEDGLAAFDWLSKEKGFKPKSIVLFGISMGTGVSCQIARQREHSGLILESGYSTFRRLTNEVVPITRFVPMIFYFRQRMDNLSVVRELETPKLIIHGAKDDLIVVDHALELYEAALEPKDLIIFPLGEHRGWGSLKATREHRAAVDDFLQKLKPAVSEQQA